VSVRRGRIAAVNTPARVPSMGGPLIVVPGAVSPARMKRPGLPPVVEKAPLPAPSRQAASPALFTW